MKFAMPFRKILEIRPSKEIDETETPFDESVDGVVYNLYWDDKPLPWHTRTRSEAFILAMGVQYGAQHVDKQRR